MLEFVSNTSWLLGARIYFVFISGRTNQETVPTVSKETLLNLFVCHLSLLLFLSCFIPTALMVRVSFSAAPECVDADCWYRFIGTLPPPWHQEHGCSSSSNNICLTNHSTIYIYIYMYIYTHMFRARALAPLRAATVPATATFHVGKRTFFATKQAPATSL